MENYTKLRIIGTGSFGTVWLIRSKEKHRNYVLKEISLSIVEEQQRSFVLNEVKVLSQLRHMNIIRYKEAFLSNGFLCISMEYAHEGDLSDRIQKQSGQMLPKEQVIDWFIQLCLAMKYIHGMNILHRDIKCQNIFISKENIIKLGDFGIACVLQNTLDHAQTVIGTPYYLSPEICQRQPYNHKSDIWALGCVLYEMITLRHPFESLDFPQLVLKILRGDYMPISKNHGTLLQDLVSVLLRVDPSERPSAKQILHIPAMQPYVNNVLARGRTQRSESVSCGEGQSVRKGSVWRKPDVIPALENEIEDKSRRNECEVDVLKHVEEKSKTFYVEGRRASENANDVACVETGKSRRKRISSEVFSEQDGRLFDETGVKKMKVWRRQDFVESNKENHKLPQPGPSKPRSYSTSIVRESAERSPLAPLDRQQARLGGTYDVIPKQKRVFQETYTKRSSGRAYVDGEIVGDRAQNSGESQANMRMYSENVSHTDRASEILDRKKRYLAKEVSHVKPGNATNQKTQTELLKVLLGGGSHMVFRSISPESSLKDYVQAMRSNLEESLGLEMFSALHKYLRFDVERDLSSGVDICETLFKALGEEGIVFVPLMLQYIECEKNVLT